MRKTCKKVNIEYAGGRVAQILGLEMDLSVIQCGPMQDSQMHGSQIQRCLTSTEENSVSHHSPHTALLA